MKLAIASLAACILAASAGSPGKHRRGGCDALRDVHRQSLAQGPGRARRRLEAHAQARESLASEPAHAHSERRQAAGHR